MNIKNVHWVVLLKNIFLIAYGLMVSVYSYMVTSKLITVKFIITVLMVIVYLMSLNLFVYFSEDLVAFKFAKIVIFFMWLVMMDWAINLAFLALQLAGSDIFTLIISIGIWENIYVLILLFVFFVSSLLFFVTYLYIYEIDNTSKDFNYLFMKEDTEQPKKSEKSKKMKLINEDDTDHEGEYHLPFGRTRNDEYHLVNDN